ncbi:MAG TPA: phospholipase D-like domain-containing protein, partial [Alcaligenes faecalis]
MDHVLGKPTSQVDLVSSYFVPTAAGVRAFEAMMQRPGMKVRILTNSLAATDVTAVHAGYAKRRKALLEAGVQLLELRPTMDKPTRHGSGPFGSSGSALHAKTFAVDGKRLFVGSFNFDPRSINLNTELGFIIESPEMAQALSKSFEEVLPYRSYRVELDKNGDLVWIQLNEDGTERFFTSEPNASIWRRAGVGVLSILPIEWLL